jgi:hypothetical protein
MILQNFVDELMDNKFVSSYKELSDFLLKLEVLAFEVN